MVCIEPSKANIVSQHRLRPLACQGPMHPCEKLPKLLNQMVDNG